jgi:predicted lipid carrier protein YhbT
MVPLYTSSRVIGASWGCRRLSSEFLCSLSTRRFYNEIRALKLLMFTQWSFLDFIISYQNESDIDFNAPVSDIIAVILLLLIHVAAATAAVQTAKHHSRKNSN